MMTIRPRIRPCLEQLEDRVLPSAAPDIALTFATTPDARTIRINYTINNASLAGQSIGFNIYRSAAYDSLNGAQLIGAATIPGSASSDLNLGAHNGVQLALTGPNGQPVTALTPNPALPFIVVVDNHDGSSASFETHVLGVIAHGLEIDPVLWLLNQVPAWETRLAGALQSDGYQAVIPFNWVFLSIFPSPLALKQASDQLYQQVVSEADQLAGQHPGDVVDINFIGHSRGTVVISEVLQDLVGTNDPALRGGYMEMTLLDPHPANPFISATNWDPFIPLANDLAALVISYELLALDPRVVVPSNVMQTQLFDQQTPAGQFGFSDLLEVLLNTWGQTASALIDQSAQPIKERNVTSVNAPGIGLIGHSEVPDWYMANVVATKETFTF